jgi:hypothetical protein
MRNLDQLERRLVHRLLELLILIPVAVSFLNDNRAFEEQALNDLAYLEVWVIGLARADRNILEITEYSQIRGRSLFRHDRYSNGFVAGPFKTPLPGMPSSSRSPMPPAIV